MNATAKQTAGNNRFLAGVKRLMNAKIYRETARLLNAEGTDAALAFLNRYFRNPMTAEQFEDVEAE
jgi:hypothetical protein